LKMGTDFSDFYCVVRGVLGFWTPCML